jgi:hypothetical protein
MREIMERSRMDRPKEDGRIDLSATIFKNFEVYTAHIAGGNFRRVDSVLKSLTTKDTKEHEGN